MGVMKANFNGTTLVRDYELRRRGKAPLERAIFCESADESGWIKTIGKILIGAENLGGIRASVVIEWILIK
jgi:hypothetical protein